MATELDVLQQEINLLNQRIDVLDQQLQLPRVTGTLQYLSGRWKLRDGTMYGR